MNMNDNYLHVYILYICFCNSLLSGFKTDKVSTKLIFDIHYNLSQQKNCNCNSERE